MEAFIINFFICNIFISVIIGILLAVKRLLKNSLTSRMQYNLWFLLLGLLAVPFIPVKPLFSLNIFSWLGIHNTDVSQAGAVMKETVNLRLPGTNHWMNDFSISLTRGTPPAIGLALCILWLLGILAMLALTAKSWIHFHILKKSALPLQNPALHRLYQDCLEEINITKDIPIYSCAFLKTPIIAGFFKPCIYLPIHVVSGNTANDIKYMLLHELFHYKYKDALANYMMNTAVILYWFNPFVWYALKEMGNDREVACDTSVLKILEEDAYKDYGNTLINFAQKISLISFPFTMGISGSMAQMKKRIINIAAYRPASLKKNIYSAAAFIMVSIVLLGFVPILTLQAADYNRYYFNERGKDITYLDLDRNFKGDSGSFVLYDTAGDSWKIYNKEYAAKRISPASTYKIYSALLGLESGIITPEESLIPWNGQEHVYDVWNGDQTLDSAMENSVTWYFQAIDRKAGLTSIENFIKEIGYGNQIADGDLSSYWADSTLKISPIEQIEMLRKFYNNEFEFLPENIEAVKDSICLYSTDNGTIYGKTGTEGVNGKNISGWFIGYIEKGSHTYFFATNIQKEAFASGTAAAELTFSILSDLKLWEAS